MEKKLDYKKPTAQVVYFDDEDIVARTVTCSGTGVQVHHKDCTANDCVLGEWDVCSGWLTQRD